jgi:hypothetical protein
VLRRLLWVGFLVTHAPVAIAAEAAQPGAGTQPASPRAARSG